MDWTDGLAVLKWIVYSGGAGTVVYFVMKRVTATWWTSASTEKKRDVSIILSIAFALIVWCFLLFVGVEQRPEPTFADWWTKLWGIAATTYLGGQFIHGKTSLRASDKLKKECSCGSSDNPQGCACCHEQ